MARTLTTIKTSARAIELLRLIAALSGEKQYEVMERLFEHEARRLQNKRAK
jgi:hypothetical protein